MTGEEERQFQIQDDVTVPGKDASVLAREKNLWKRLADAKTVLEIAPPWLAIQCQKIDSVRQGVIALQSPENEGFQPAAFWPVGQPSTKAMSRAAEQAMADRRGVADGGMHNDPSEQNSRAVVAFPLILGGLLYGVVSLEMDKNDGPSLRNAMRQLQWGVAWLQERLRAEQGAKNQEALERSDAALDLAVIALQKERLNAACQSVVTEIAHRTNCERVSIGFVKRGHCQINTISLSAQFAKQMNLVRLLEAAMDESIDQRVSIVIPDKGGEGAYVTRAHQELATKYGAGSILTIPLFDEEGFVGALTFERPDDHPFDQATVNLLECAAAVIGPILNEKRQNDRWIFFKLASSAFNQIKRLLGPGYVGRKLMLVGILALLVLFNYAKTDYRVTADARIEGLVQRAVVAPFDGFIIEAPARAGDTVRQGQLLAGLDERELALERLRWVTERQQHVYEFEQALGARQRAQTNISKAQIEQSDAQINLIDKQLERAKLLAPFDGLIVSGDLSQSIGAAIRRGDVLFEVAPLAGYRVLLWVGEDEIARLRTGQQGHLVATALPQEFFRFELVAITPVTEVREGRNMIRVEAKLVDISDRLRPGMAGIGKIEIEPRRLIWIWTRPMIEWMRLWLWRWIP